MKYSLEIKIPNEENLIIKKLNMTETCEIIKKTFKEKYFIDIKCNNQIIYNLLKRPQTVSPILKSIVSVFKDNSID
jgi:hypothetical protein